MNPSTTTNNRKRFLAIDPGERLSGFVIIRGGEELPHIESFGKITNESTLEVIDAEVNSAMDAGIPPVVVCEYVQPRGQLLTYQVVNTVFWSGRFMERLSIGSRGSGIFERVDRASVQSEICNKRGAKDAQVRSALIDMWGGASSISGPTCRECKGSGGWGRGGKRIKCPVCENGRVQPGKLFGISDDVWQALGLAVSYWRGVQTVDQKNAARDQAE